MVKTIIAFLRSLEEVVPPPAGCHHVLAYARYGTKDQYTHQLALQVNVGGFFTCYFLNDADIENAEKTIRFIQEDLSRPRTAGTAEGTTV
jgi:hypothetical protein